MVNPVHEPASTNSPGYIAFGNGLFIFNDILGNTDRPCIIHICPPSFQIQVGNNPYCYVMRDRTRQSASAGDSVLPSAERYFSIIPAAPGIFYHLVFRHVSPLCDTFMLNNNRNTRIFPFPRQHSRTFTPRQPHLHCHTPASGVR